LPIADCRLKDCVDSPSSVNDALQRPLQLMFCNAGLIDSTNRQYFIANRQYFNRQSSLPQLPVHLHKVEVVPGFNNLSIFDSHDCDSGEINR
jgi:hypothetical protein